MQPKSPHWADLAAFKVLKEKASTEKKYLTVASGITPSGYVHIGNFREVITVDLVAKALRDVGQQVRFIYSWDDFDTFRKVPKNLPNQEQLAKELRRPISRVPDPYGVHQSYAQSNIKRFESEIKLVGIQPEFIYQHERYSNGIYAEQIKTALENKDRIKTILDQFRKEPLGSDWLPTAIYCEECDRDEMVYERYDGGYDYGYKCIHCQKDVVTDIRKTKNLKLNWRTDWPMRWAYEGVDFEPGGKDHSSDGGSFDTASLIVKEVWAKQPPVYLQYDFVSIRGGTGKMSSSSGELIRLADALEVYSPHMVRWIFASQRPNTDFALAFDLDVIKVHDEFDRAEAVYFNNKERLDRGEPANPKDQLTMRTYELAVPENAPVNSRPYRPAFRQLCDRLQTFNGDIEKTLAKCYTDYFNNDFDREEAVKRSKCAWTWLEKYAPDEFRWRLNSKLDTSKIASDLEQKAFAAMVDFVKNNDLESMEPKAINDKLYAEVIHAVQADGQIFFKFIYQLLISRDQGPRLPSFLKEIGNKHLRELFVP